MKLHVAFRKIHNIVDKAAEPEGESEKLTYLLGKIPNAVWRSHEYWSSKLRSQNKPKL